MNLGWRKATHFPAPVPLQHDGEVLVPSPESTKYCAFCALCPFCDHARRAVRFKMSICFLSEDFYGIAKVGQIVDILHVLVCVHNLALFWQPHINYNFIDKWTPHGSIVSICYPVRRISQGAKNGEDCVLTRVKRPRSNPPTSI